MKMNPMDYVVWLLLIIGGLNWGLWGAFEFDVVAEIFGGNTEVVSKVIYIIVGVAAIWSLIRVFTMKKGDKAPEAMTTQQ